MHACTYKCKYCNCLGKQNSKSKTLAFNERKREHKDINVSKKEWLRVSHTHTERKREKQKIIRKKTIIIIYCDKVIIWCHKQQWQWLLVTGVLQSCKVKYIFYNNTISKDTQHTYNYKQITYGVLQSCHVKYILTILASVACYYSQLL